MKFTVISSILDKEAGINMAWEDIELHERWFDELRDQFNREHVDLICDPNAAGKARII